MNNIIRFFHFLYFYLKKRNSPTTVNFDITTKCNLSCEHCYWLINNHSKKEKTEVEWNKIFKEFHDKGTVTAFLTGGEPALRPEIIRLSCKIFETTSVVSNGSIKIPDDIKIRIFISIDGPEEIHNHIRGKNIFDTVIKNISNDKRVILAPTLSTTNFIYIDELINIARQANVAGIVFSMYTSQMGKDDPLLLQGEKLDTTIKLLSDARNRNKGFFLMTPYMIKLLRTKKHNKNCYMANQKKIISLDADLNQKKPCVLGKKICCSTCGCFVAVMAHALSKFDVRAWFIFNKIFPCR